MSQKGSEQTAKGSKGKSRFHLSERFAWAGNRRSNASQSGSKADHLRFILRGKLEHFNDAAIKTNGEIPAGQLESLERLARAVRLSDELGPVTSRWPPVIGLILALSLVSLLLLVRVPRTQIALNVEASEISFVLPAEKPLTGLAGVRQLGVSGFDHLRIRPEIDSALSAKRLGQNTGMIRVSIPSNAASVRLIYAAPLIPPAGTRVWIRQMEAPKTYRLSLKPPDRRKGIEVRAEIQGLIEMAVPGVTEGLRSYDFGRSGGTVEIGSQKDILDLDFVLGETAEATFYTQVPVESLVFIRVEEFDGSQRSLVRPLSTLLGGSLSLKSLNGEKHELSAGEQIRFEASEGRIDTLQLKSDRLILKFSGTVSGIKIGEGEASRNLMPNLLEWLKARRPLSLVWGATLFAYGLFINLLRWYRRSA